MRISSEKIARETRERKKEVIVQQRQVKMTRELDLKRRLGADYNRTYKVVDFFYANCPIYIKDTEMMRIEKKLFNEKSSKSVLGTINYLQEYIGENWEEWTAIAKMYFDINY